ncbi:MAG: type II CAAX endopeptidase family protein [Thermoanaerobaculia bacterium]
MVLAIVVPALAWMSRRALESGARIPRLPLYAEVVVLQLLLFGLAMLVAWSGRFSIFSRRLPTLDGWAAGAILLLIATVAMLLNLRFGTADHDDPLYRIAPESMIEKLAWIGVSCVAGVSEEVIYRGAAYVVIQRLVHGIWPPILIASVLFGMAHLTQGIRRSALVALFGFGFHLVVLYSGSLYPAFVVHALYDILAGLALARDRRRRNWTEHATL